MARDHWRDAIADIDETRGPVTGKQKALAAIAGIELPEDLPQLVARLRLLTALARTLALHPADRGPASAQRANWSLSGN
jgi:hypothetical protein